MMSDHWKSIAKFLGTPGLPDDPAPEEESQPAVDDKPAATEPVGAAEDVKPQAPSDEIRWERDAAKDDAQAAAILGSPEPKSEPLPGFGADPHASTGGNWDSLVESFGIEAASEPAAPVAQPREEVPVPAAAEKRSSRPPRRQEPSGGFGQGLGFEAPAEPEANEVQSAESVEEVDPLDGFGKLPDEDSPRSRGRGRRDQGSRSRREGSRDREEEPRERSEEASEQVEETRERSGSAPGRDEESRGRGEGRRTRGGRGRRGARRDALPQDEASLEEPQSEKRNTEERKSEGRQAERSFGEAPARKSGGSRRRSESFEKPKRPEVDDLLNFASFNDLPDDVDELDLVGDESSDDDVAVVESSQRDDVEASERSDAEAEEGEEGGTRRRRRGRRGGRRRGRGGNGGASESSETADSNVSPEPEAEVAVPKVSEFDDDHEDDDEVIALRRGNRRRRGRRGRGGSGEGREESTGRDESSGGRDLAKPEAEAEVRQSSRRGEASRDEAEEDIKPRQRDIPSWIETVDLLVQPNINARGKRSAPRGRGGKGRRRDSE
ncbi:hypothetical protein EC9_23460 [Rosistilla ulvae]|uniref:Uncharacterized protein n=1 Tax=Rosistilla ulvae TaxID=1930277 RepID=A0A517LZX3_9BACT|nr:hypothetical protein [Rosistilla ulvae]QDS88159.1 hypothetical protein EC9_23460 [Rosistilla ulvae]